MENGYIWHILAVGLPPDFAPGDVPDFAPRAGQESGGALAARARAAGAFVAIAHPEWSGLSLADAPSIESAHAVEVYNHSCAVDADRPRGFSILDRMLSVGDRPSLCATDDTHFAAPDAFGGWVMVKAETNTRGSLLSALKAGRYFASTGADLFDVDWGTDTVRVRSSPG